jgi:hypothetical protein
LIGKLTSIVQAGPWTLALTWDDGATFQLDLTDIIQAESILLPLRQPEQFAQAALSSDGWSVEWPCGIDFGAPQLRSWAETQIAAEAV